MNKHIIFVIGTGRSGTHLIGRIIGSHPRVKPFIEDERFFHLSTQIATGQLRDNKIKKLVKNYRVAFSKVKEDYILEKSHPNIWHVERLNEAFDKSYFVGIYRDVYSTVSSMLKHQGVLSWFDTLAQDKINPFLGITEYNINYYKSLPVHQKCALRWLSHKQRLTKLNNRYPSNVKILNYNELLTGQTAVLDDLATFLKLENKFEPEEFNMESMTKWKENLTEHMIDDIDEIIEQNDT
ncbi:MAG: sulfotransferase [Fulvivirga sp.]|nr:sulfotransferase [Fulvivirga sp.]